MADPNEGPSGLCANYNVITDNKYSSLSESEANFADAEGFTTIGRNRKSKLKRKTDGEVPVSKKLKKRVEKDEMPPIKAFNINVKSVFAALCQKMKPEDFTINNANRNLTLIYTHTISDFKNALQILKDLANNHFTYTPKAEKPVSLLLRGVHNSYDENEVKEALNDINFANKDTKIINTQRYSTTHSKALKIELPLYLVQFSPFTRIQDVMEVKYLLHQQIKWEIIQKTDIIQCYRCQRFGHVARNCFMPFRCIKCVEPHDHGECKLKKPDENSEAQIQVDDSEKNKQNTPQCVNCKMMGHTANYRNCPVAKKLLDKRKDRTKHRDESKTNSNNGKTEKIQEKVDTTFIDFSEKNFPYATAVKSHTKNNSTSQSAIKTGLEEKNTINHNSNGLNFIENECQNLLGENLFSIIDKIEKFIPSYKQITNTTEKKKSLIQFVLSIVITP